MALRQTQQQLRSNVRKFANVQGATALLRHPDTDLNDYINRALGSLHRKLTAVIPDQRFLSSTTVEIVADTSLYDLPSDFDALISAEIYATTSGPRYWLQAYEMSERPELENTNVQVATGMPLAYRLQDSNVEFLPVPDGDYTCLLWYTPSTSQLSGDADTYDTISRLDDFIIAYAARPIAIKDKNWDLASTCKALMDEMTEEIEALGRNRDRNSPPRIVDVYTSDRWGRQRRRYR